REALDLPAACARDSREARLGIDRARVADDFHRVPIAERIAVVVARVEVEVVLAREPLDGGRLALAPARGTNDAPRQNSPLRLEACARDVLDAEVSRDWHS